MFKNGKYSSGIYGKLEGISFLRYSLRKKKKKLGRKSICNLIK